MNDYAINITEALDKCTEDITCLDTVTLDAHIRAYALLSELLSDDIQICFGNDKFTQAAENFLKAMKSHSIVYDVDAATKDLEEKLYLLAEKVEQYKSEEESKKQSFNMCTVNVSISHNNNLAIS